MKFARNYLKQCITSEKIEIGRLEGKKKQAWEEVKLESVIKLVAELEEVLKMVEEKINE